MSVRNEIEQALNTPFDAAKQGLDESKYAGLGVYHDGPTLEKSWVVISRELNTDSGTLTPDGKWIPAPDPTARTSIDIQSDIGQTKGEFKDIVKLKNKFLNLTRNLPEGSYYLHADNPTKAKYYQRVFKDHPWIGPSGEQGGLRVKGEMIKYDTLKLNIPDAETRFTQMQNSTQFRDWRTQEVPMTDLSKDTSKIAQKYDMQYKMSNSKIDHPPAALRLKWIEDYNRRKQEAGNKKISATYNYKGLDFTLYTNKKAKGGMSTKPSVFAARNALLRLHRKRGKVIPLNERIKILQKEFPDSPLNEVKALAKQVHELNERDILEKTKLAQRTGQNVEDRTPISGEEYGWRSRHNLEVDDPEFNLQKADKFPGEEYAKWKGIGRTKEDQVRLDLSSPLNQTKDGPVRITPDLDAQQVRKSLIDQDTIAGLNRKAFNLGESRRLAKQAAITGSLIAYGGLGTAASAFETDQRRRIAKHTGNILDYIQYGISGFSLGADALSYVPHPATIAAASVASGVADVINTGIDTTRDIVSDVKRGYRPEKPPEEPKEENGMI